MKHLAKQKNITTEKDGTEVDQVLAFVFYTIFLTVSVAVLMIVGMYSVWMNLFKDEEVEPEDRIFR
jgi:hypothetical protein